MTVAAIAPPALAAFFQVREVADGRAVAGELFRYRYREQAPEHGLVLGFSGFLPETLRQAAETFARRLDGSA